MAEVGIYLALTCADMRPFFRRVRSVWLQWLRAQGTTLRKSSSKLGKKKKKKSDGKIIKDVRLKIYEKLIASAYCSLEVVESVVEELAYIPG